MQIDIAETIRETLGEMEPVGLHGIGTLSLNRISASFGEQRRSLLPPRMELVFSDNAASNVPLISWIADKYDITKYEAENAYKSFCEMLLNALVNYGKVNLKGVGLFYSDAQQQLRCKADDAFLSLFYRNLPEIPIKLIGHSEEKNTVFPQKEGTSTIITAVLPVDDLPIVNNTASPIPKEEPSVTADSKTDVSLDEGSKLSKIEESILTFSERKSKAEEKKASKAESTIPPDWNTQWNPRGNDKKSDIFNVRNILLLLALLALLLLGYFGCSKLLTSNKDKLTDSELLDGNLLDSNEVSKVGLIDSTELDLNATILPEKCIIITGAFHKSRNAIKMQTQLLQQGHEVYMNVHNGFTRVGLKFDCKEINLEDYLQDVRRKISKRAWYLDPELYVEYEK